MGYWDIKVCFFTPGVMNMKYTHQPPRNSPIDMPLNEYDLK